MYWGSITFDWNQVRAFLVTVEEGSYSAAARALNLSQPTLSRQVNALEEQLGVTLFERAGKGLVLTTTGQDLVVHVRAMGDAAQMISLVASGRSQEVQGLVRITASDSVAVHILPPILERLREKAPAIDVEIVASNEIRDLLRREADIAIRHVRPTQPDVFAKLVRETTGHLYGSPEFLDTHGRPESMADLARYPCIGTESPERMKPYLDAYDYDIPLENFRFRSGSTVAGWNLVRQGLGLGFMSRDVAGLFDDVEEVLPGIARPFPIPVWLVTHRELKTSALIRTVFDHLSEEFTGPGDN